MASDKRLDQVKLVNSAESVLVVNGDQVEKAALAGFANSMGSSVPLQQTSEQVSITGLYARTSDGKMVELTKESVASVMGNLLYGADTLAELSSGVAQQNRLYIGEGCAVRTELKNDFDTSVLPAASGCRVRFDNNDLNGIGHELFFARGGGLWFWNEQGGGWKEVATK